MNRVGENAVSKKKKAFGDGHIENISLSRWHLCNMSRRGSGCHPDRGNQRKLFQKQERVQRQCQQGQEGLLGSAKSAPECTLITECLANHTGKSIDPDVSRASKNPHECATLAQALEKPFDEKDKEGTAPKEHSVKVVFDCEIDAHTCRKEKCRQDVQEACHFMWQQCDSAVKSEILANWIMTALWKINPLNHSRSSKSAALVMTNRPSTAWQSHKRH